MSESEEPLDGADPSLTPPPPLRLGVMAQKLPSCLWVAEPTSHRHVGQTERMFSGASPEPTQEEVTELEKDSITHNSTDTKRRSSTCPHLRELRELKEEKNRRVKGNMSN